MTSENAIRGPGSSIERVTLEDQPVSPTSPIKNRPCPRAYTCAKSACSKFRGEMMLSNKMQSGRQPVVLCVDDELRGLYFRTLILEESGYKVLASAHPSHALMIIEHEFVDIAVVNYQMPDMNGSELSRFIKKKTPRTRIIMLSRWLHIPEEDLSCVDFFVSRGDGMSRVLEIISGFLTEEGDSDLYSEGSPATAAPVC